MFLITRFTLRKQISVYEDKLRDVPRVEHLEKQLFNKMIEQEAIKKQLEKLEHAKQKESESMQYQFNLMQSQFQNILSILGSVGQEGKQEIAKMLIGQGMYKASNSH